MADGCGRPCNGRTRSGAGRLSATRGSGRVQPRVCQLAATLQSMLVNLRQSVCSALWGAVAPRTILSGDTRALPCRERKDPRGSGTSLTVMAGVARAFAPYLDARVQRDTDDARQVVWRSL